MKRKQKASDSEVNSVFTHRFSQYLSRGKFAFSNFEDSRISFSGACFKLMSFARIGVLSAFALTGCTTQLSVISDQEKLAKLQEEQTVDGKSIVRPPEGVVYYLPATEFQVTTSWMLEACSGTFKSPSARFTVSLDIKESFVADRTKPYFIDYPKLEAALKHSDLSVKLRPNGTLASVNALIADKSGEVAASLLKAVGNVGTILFGVSRVEKSPCVDLATAVDARQTLAKQTKALRETIDSIVARDPLTDADKSEIQRKKKELALKTAALANAISKTSYTQRNSWLPKGVEEKFDIPMGEAAMRKFFSEEFLSETDPEVVDARDKLKAEVSPFTTLSPSGGTSETGLIDSEYNPEDHLIYRTPTPTNLSVFLMSPEPGQDSNLLLKQMTVRLPQGGIRMALPLKNPAFDRANLVAKFAEDGGLTEFQFVTEAQAAEIAKTIATGAETVEGIATTIAGSELQQLQSEAALLRAEADLIKAKQELDALQAEQAVQ